MIERHSAQHVVTAIEERFRYKHIKGVGNETIMSKESQGWYIVLDNYIALYIGPFDPKIEVGSKVNLALEIPRYDTA